MSVIEIKNPLKMALWISIFIFLFLMFVVPLDQLLPPALQGFIPPYLINTTILLYIQKHFEFIIKVVGLGFILFVLWKIIKD